MPLAHRYGFALAGLLAAGMLMSPGPAWAGQTPTVTFNGGCRVQGAGAASEPDAGSPSVPAEGLAIFVNHLGHPATLLVDGHAAATLAANDQVSVVFHHGPVAMQRAPACLPAADAVPLDVAVIETGGYATGRYPGMTPAAHPAQAASHRRGAPRTLVLVAVICVIAVSGTTIQAIIAQRAIRTASA
jgi:hypothetical protein